MSRRLRVAVLFGGQSPEHTVSRASAAGVLAHLDRARYEVRPVEITPAGRWLVYADGGATPGAACPAERPAGSPGGTLAEIAAALAGVDVVFPVLHGSAGEDGTVQGLLETIGLPYVGCGVAASAVGLDKAVTKAVLQACGLRIAPGVTLSPDRPAPDRAERARLGLPVFVKPARAGSSIGVSRVTDEADLPAAVARARAVDGTVLVEAAVPGREVDVGLLQHPDGEVVAGPPLEIVLPDGDFFDGAHKYASARPPFRVPAALDQVTTALLQERARQVFTALGGHGLMRVDFFVRPGEEPVVNEVNTMPGMTASSQYPQMWAAAGLSYRAVLDVLVATAWSAGRRR
ncbi:D-alanine--D-alanine ligase family protein [Geodermatophilus ruber]|uniref:D-alanine--D-alanine ligase family protein n=1 Tax=Geodermatophilus ruber TaxID=504800 RepID=UPI001FDFF0CC|nr:D-alanine--D-alanine ligase family protein [Geodermatophilus ruber]